MHTRLWKFLKSTPYRVASQFWRPRSPSEDYTHSSRRGDCGLLPSVSVDYDAAPPFGPATLPPPNICPHPNDTPPHAVQVSEDASRNRTANGSSSSPFSVPSRAPPSRSRKIRSNPCSRTRAFAQFLRHYRRKYATPTHHDDVALITMSELSSIDPLQEDDEDADWEDIASRKVRVLL